MKRTNENTRKKYLKNIRSSSSEFFKKKELAFKKEAFNNAYKNVPAYKKFVLKKTRKPSFFSWDNLPTTSKNDYLKKYSYSSLFVNGKLGTPLVYTSTSGSTGKPFYFARSSTVDVQASIIHQLFLENNITSFNKPTLIVVCFGMGVWIGGLISYESFKQLDYLNYPLSIITPGINKEEIFKILKDICPKYDQVILMGYAPFLKDVIDEAPDREVNIKKLNFRIVFAAEAFTENFRDYISKKVNINNPLLDTMNIYGSADAGVMAFETPLSILIRRLAKKNDSLYTKIFRDSSKTPTLCQYNPEFISFEEKNGELYITTNSALPLIKYDIGDMGGILSYKEIDSIFKSENISLQKEVKKARIEKMMYKLPFVYVYERKDLSVTLYGLQIYPETIKESLIEKPYSSFFTGKLTLITKFNKKHDQFLEINLELKPGVKKDNRIQRNITKHILNSLLLNNSEFGELYKFIGKRAIPKIILWPNEHEIHFKRGIKQKWVKKYENK